MAEPKEFIFKSRLDALTDGVFAFKGGRRRGEEAEGEVRPYGGGTPARA